MKTKLFALLTALSLVSAPAFAEIDLTPYEVTDDALSRVMLIQPGLVLVHHDSGMSDGQFPTSIELYSAKPLTITPNGSCVPLFS